MDRQLLRRIMALIFPVRCPVCSCIISPGETFCGECKEKLVRFDGVFSVTGAESFFAPFEYTPEIRRAIMLMKDGIAGNAPFAFAAEIADVLRSADIVREIDMIIPVPMHKSDVRKRGFNQSELIANELGKELEIAVKSDIAVKRRFTLPQKSLTREQREINLYSAFSLTDKEAIKGQNILILDDVCTTGSTLSELTGLFKQSGSGNVWCASCCKTSGKGGSKDNDV